MTTQGHQLFRTAVRLGTLLLLCAFGVNLPAFPIERFKEFINNKPTVEKLVFECQGTRYLLPPGDDTNAFRPCVFVFQSNRAFSMVEDCRNFRTSAKTDFNGRFGDLFWNRLNSNDVLTVEIPEATNRTGIYSPRYSQVNLGLDVLNFGIACLGEKGVIWDGLAFKCPTNLSGFSITGQLYLDSNGVPDHIDMLYNSRSRYIASYKFESGRGLPDFFPSEIRVEFVGSGVRRTEGLYRIQKAEFSHRDLTFRDVDFAGLLETESLHFFKTNNNNAMFLKTKDLNGRPVVVPVLEAVQRAKR